VTNSTNRPCGPARSHANSQPDTWTPAGDVGL